MIKCKLHNLKPVEATQGAGKLPAFAVVYCKGFWSFFPHRFSSFYKTCKAVRFGSFASAEQVYYKKETAPQKALHSPTA